MDFNQVINAIETISFPAFQADWDRSGLQVACSRSVFHQIGVFLDPLPGNIRNALDGGADFLISHHPLSLKPALPAKLDNYYEALSLLMKAGVPLYAAHTSLDINLAGPAGWLGRSLDLLHKTPLEPLPDHPELGYGEIGDLPEPLNPLKFQTILCSLLKLKYIIQAGYAKLTCPVRRIAYCGGSGASLIESAARAGVDLYITGDIKYHSALDASIPIWDIGHHSLEEEMMARFAATLRDLGIPASFYSSESPFELVASR